MIRVHKSENTPKSLTTTKGYDGEDVKAQLISDQFGKCYLCERVRDTDFQIEHFKSQTNNEALVTNWNNLFLSCSYCNGKKLQNFDNLLNPALINIEDEIKQLVSFQGSKVTFEFTPNSNTESHKETANILYRIHNGTKGIRTIKENIFASQVVQTINTFQASIYRYLETPTTENEDAVRSQLSIEQEFLGLKYWIIKGNPALSKTFANDIIWNKK